MRMILVATLTLGFAGTAYAQDCKPLQIINSVKTEPVAQSGLVSVPITVNGAEKKFLLNSASAADQMTHATAEGLGLPLQHSRTRVAGLDTMDYVQVKDLTYGLQHGGTQFMVMNNSDLPIDGSFSLAALNKQDLDLDFGAQRVNYFSADHCDGKVLYWSHQALSVIPVKIEQNHMDVPVELDGHAMRAIIATGAVKTSLNLARAKELLNFSPDAPTTGAHPADDAANQIYPRRFASLSFDGVTIQNPLISVQPLDVGGGKANAAAAGGAVHKDDYSNLASADLVIGMDILRHLHLYLASREGKLYITEAGQGESVLFKSASAPAAAPPAK